MGVVMNGEMHMAKFPYNPMQPRKAVFRRPRKRPRFKWGIVLIPGTILLAFWLASGISIGFTWDDILNAIHAHDRRRATQLFVLGMVAVGVVSIARILRKNSNKSEDK